MNTINPDQGVAMLSAHHMRTRVKLEELLENNDVARQLHTATINAVMAEKQELVKKLKDAQNYIKKLEDHMKSHNLEVPQESEPDKKPNQT